MPQSPQSPPKVSFLNLSDLIPSPTNARTHSPEQIKQIAASIERFGFTQPILADGLNIIAGHGRCAAVFEIYARSGAIRLPSGAPVPPGKVPVIDVSGWSEDDRRAYMLADNAIALAAGWDEELLKSELGALSAANFDMSLLGFEMTEIDRLLGKREGATDPDDVPPVPEEPVSQLGDIWLLGDHRIICGSSTDPDDVAAVLAGEKPHLCVTDPPYGVEYDANWRNERVRADGSPSDGRAIGKVENDNQSDWREAWALFPGDVAYVWHAGLHARQVVESLEATGFEMRAQIIWAKQQFAIGRGDYHFQHEPCQPAGTMVQKVIKPGRWREHSIIESVPIETLVEGDMVVSFGGAKIFRRGRRLNGISSRQYVGNMHAVAAGDLQTSATAEHQFTVRFDPAKAKSSVVYIMRRGERWRIGVCGLFNSRGFGPAVRLSQEKGEELWIVSAHPDLMAARVAEQVASCIYGIPTTHWETDRNPGGLGFRTHVEIKNIYRQIGTERIASGVARLFDEFGLQLGHPLILSDDIGRFSRRQSRIVRSCNLVPGIMQLPIPTKGEDFEWRSITSTQFEPFEGPVWSMEVDQDRHYVADGIVTHNCWYAVRKGKKGHYVGGRKQSTLWQIDKPQKSETGHSTQKPIECMKRPIENNSVAGDAVYEPFSGSSTTIIACQMTGRRCFAVELSPNYVDVGVLRWQDFTQREAVLESTGQTFTQVKAERAA